MADFRYKISMCDTWDRPKWWQLRKRLNQAEQDRHNLERAVAALLDVKDGMKVSITRLPNLGQGTRLLIASSYYRQND